MADANKGHTAGHDLMSVILHLTQRPQAQSPIEVQLGVKSDQGQAQRLLHKGKPSEYRL